MYYFSRKEQSTTQSFPQDRPLRGPGLPRNVLRREAGSSPELSGVWVAPGPCRAPWRDQQFLVVDEPSVGPGNPLLPKGIWSRGRGREMGGRESWGGDRRENRTTATAHSPLSPAQRTRQHWHFPGEASGPLAIALLSLQPARCTCFPRSGSVLWGLVPAPHPCDSV